jgi:acyl dehydratase
VRRVTGYASPVTDTVISSVHELKQLVGQETRVGDWFEVTQDRVNAFADATGDHQWIHVDVERAKNGPFGVTIAHGLLTLSVSSLLFQNSQGVKLDLKPKMGINYGYNRIRFPAPVPVGTRIRGHTKLLSVEEVQPGVIQQVQELTVEVEGSSKPAMVAEQVTRMYL